MLAPKCDKCPLLLRSYIKSEAVLRIMEYLNLPFPQLAAILKIAPL